MVRVCLKCERRIPHDDEPFGECAGGVGDPCGSKEWAVVDVPLKEYELSANDRLFLKSIRVAPEV